MKKILYTAVVLIAGVVSADTVYHYTFDNLSGGEVLPEIVPNVANPGVLDGTAIPLSAAQLFPGECAKYIAWMPTNIVGTAEGFGTFDPAHPEQNVTQQDYAIAFHTNGNVSAVIQVANDKAIRSQEFTFEVVVRLPMEADISSWNAIAVQPAFMPCANADAWGLRLVSGGLKARFTPPQKFKSGVNATGNIEVSGSNIRDGKWHHVALVVKPNADNADVDKTDVALYLDYEVNATKTLDFPVQFSTEETCPVWIGGNHQTSAVFHGELSEVRFSNEALDMSKFLCSRALGLGVVPEYIKAWYSFDTRTDTATDFKNRVNPSSLPGKFMTKTAYGEQVPRLTEEVIYPMLFQSANNREAVTNSHSFYNGYEGARNTGSRGYIADPSDMFRTNNFTVECIFKFDGDVQQFTPLVRRIGGGNVQINLGVSNNANILSAVVLPAGSTDAAKDQITLSDSESLNDGNWHHAALVVNQDEQKMYLYRDYALVSSTTLKTNELVGAATQDITIGGVANGNAFNGWIDEVRISTKVLDISEFIRYFESPADDDVTLAHVKFDDGTMKSDTWIGIMDRPITAVVDSGSLPVLGDDVWRKYVVLSNNPSEEYRDNVQSLALNHSKVRYEFEKNILELRSQTVEFFVKATAQQDEGYIPLIRSHHVSNSAMQPLWAFSIVNGTSLNMRCDFKQANGSYLNNTISAVLKTGFLDGKWHHVALTLNNIMDGDVAKTQVQVFVDYERIYNVTPAGEAVYNGSGDMWIGAGSNSAYSFVGNVDEVRISRGVLSVDEFLRSRNDRATIIIIR